VGGGVTGTADPSGGTAGRGITAVAGDVLVPASELAIVWVKRDVDEVRGGGEANTECDGIPVVRGAGNTQGEEQCCSTSYTE